MNGPYASAPSRPLAPRSAFGAILRNEARLVWRQPAGAITAIGIATVILVILGVLPVFKQPRSRLGGLTPFQVYRPSPTTSPIATHGPRSRLCKSTTN